MKRTWMGVIMAGAILSSGCATIAGGALDLSGARSGSALAGPGTSAGAGDAMTFQKGPVYATSGEDLHSFGDPAAHRPSPTSPLGVAPRVPILVGPEDSPLAEWGILGFGVRGRGLHTIRREWPRATRKSDDNR